MSRLKSTSRVAAKVGCAVDSLIYHPQRLAGRLYIAEGDSADMHATVALFQAIDPSVRKINVTTGDFPSEEFALDKAGVWQARRLTPAVRRFIPEAVLFDDQ